MLQLMSDPLGQLFGTWSTQINTASILFRLSLSFIFAAIIGCERSSKRLSAGLRTFILVSLTSSMAILIDQSIEEGCPAISLATVAGIAIISTYSILYSSKSQIKGLTTAVGLWSCSILGLAFGGGYYTLAFGGFFAIILCLSLLPKLENFLKNNSNHFEIHLELKDKHYLLDFITTLRKLGMRIDDIESNPAYLNSGLGVFSISLTIVGSELKKYKNHQEIIEALSSLDYVSFVEEIH